VLGTVDFGIADHGERPGHEQAPQIAIALFADIAQLVFAPARVLLWNEPDPGRQHGLVWPAVGAEQLAIDMTVKEMRLSLPVSGFIGPF
jgi:hypothetical protein